jgi:hypothetical protein
MPEGREYELRESSNSTCRCITLGGSRGKPASDSGGSYRVLLRKTLSPFPTSRFKKPNRHQASQRWPPVRAGHGKWHISSTISIQLSLDMRFPMAGATELPSIWCAISEIARAAHGTCQSRPDLAKPRGVGRVSSGPKQRLVHSFWDRRRVCAEARCSAYDSSADLRSARSVPRRRASYHR